MSPNGLAHHGVLPHQDHSLPAQRHADLLHLLGTNVVRSHDEAFWIIIQELLCRDKPTESHYKLIATLGYRIPEEFSGKNLQKKRSLKKNMVLLLFLLKCDFSQHKLAFRYGIKCTLYVLRGKAIIYHSFPEVFPMVQNFLMEIILS